MTIVVLFVVPVLSRGARRQPQARPVALGLGGLFVVGVAGLTLAGLASTPPKTIAERGIQLNSSQVLGRSLYEANCASCHGDHGQGTKDGPSLEQVGGLRDPAFIHRYIEDPKALNPNAKMTQFIPPPGGQQVLTHEQVEDITQYLITFR